MWVCRVTRQNPAPPAESLLIRAFKQLPSKSSLFYPRPLSLPALQSLVRHQKAKRNREQKFLPETTQSSSTLPFPPSRASAWLTRSRELFFEAFPPFEASHWQSTQSDTFASLAPTHYPGELVSQWVSCSVCNTFRFPLCWCLWSPESGLTRSKWVGEPDHKLPTNAMQW